MLDKKMPYLGEIFECGSQKLKIKNLIAPGLFSNVYELVKLSNEELSYAMKVEKRITDQRRVLVLDAKILLVLSGRMGFPQLFVRGRTSHYNYIIMQYLGPSLTKLRLAAPNRKFSNSTALRIAYQTLERIKTLHEANYINRDVKASNFAVGLHENSSHIYMFDFGLSRCFVDFNGNILKARKCTALLGTIIYTSLASHNLRDQCRRDDLESWFYMCVEMFTGFLPWEELNPWTQHIAIAEWKMFIRTGARVEFLKQCPLEFSSILDMIDSCGYKQTPNYWKIFAELDSAFKRLEVDRFAPFDWEIDETIYQRAIKIGDIGESQLIPQQLRALDMSVVGTGIQAEDIILLTPPSAKE